MNILFLPIDIDFSNLNLEAWGRPNDRTPRNPFWDTININNEEIKNNCSAILEQLPFTKITTLTYKIQKRPAVDHVDVFPTEIKLGPGYETNNKGMIFEEGEFENIKANEPAGYRIVLKGKTDSLEVFDGKEWVVASVPAVPCCYLISSMYTRHRTTEDTNREIVYIRGIIDSQRHTRLIQQSLEKYKSYAIQLL